MFERNIGGNPTTTEGSLQNYTFPKSTFFIVGHEFCDWFNRYGMQSKCPPIFTDFDCIRFLWFCFPLSCFGVVFYTKINVRRLYCHCYFSWLNNIS